MCECLKTATWLFLGRVWLFLVKTDWQPRAAQLLAVTSQLAAMLRFVDHGNILELISSLNSSVERQG